jgi:hypothetical protein
VPNPDSDESVDRSVWASNFVVFGRGIRATPVFLSWLKVHKLKRAIEFADLSSGPSIGTIGLPDGVIHRVDQFDGTQRTQENLRWQIGSKLF